MYEIVTLMLPILLLIGLGLFAVKMKMITPEHIEGLAAFVLNFALPAVLLSALARQDISKSFNLGYVLAYGAGSLVTFFIAMAVLRLWLRRPMDRATMGAFGASMSNSGFIAFPVTSIVFGEIALLAIPLSMLIENVLIMPLTFVLIEWANSGKESALSVLRQTASRLSRMPLLLAIVCGLGMALLDLSFPAPVVRSLDMLAAASAPAALFVVGSTIASLRPGDLQLDMVPIIVGKMLLHPLAVTVAFFLVPGVPAQLAAVGIVISAVSMVTIYPILSRRVGMEGLAAAALVIATGICLFSLPVVLALVGR
jgi:malonate transporter